MKKQPPTQPAEHPRPTPEQVLQQRWGYASFRSIQREVIEAVLAGRDTLALMPTGGGKSLTYQIPALIMDGVTVVITPLIALMKDQVDSLRRRGISAVAIHSGMSLHQIDIALDNCVYGDVKLLYISPERLATDLFRMRLYAMRVSLIAVDEAHCISQWGYDFRPSYLRIAEVRERMADVPILALTASSTEAVNRDIMRNLRFASPHIIRASFMRPNLSYVVRHTDDKYFQLMRIVRNVEGSGIVYMRSREGCEQLAERLRQDGISANFYHAGLPTLERSMRQDEWLQGKTRIIVATNAFGMGIDKADVRFVVHYAMCDSLEAYYQEAGRAGRDGVRSYAVLLVAPDDCSTLERHFDNEFPPVREIVDVYDAIGAFLQVAIGEGRDTSHIFNIYDFCRHTSRSLARVEYALKYLEMNGYMTLLDEDDNPARMMFACSRDSLYKLNAEGNDMDLMLRTVLRMYDGLFSHFRTINECDIAANSGLSVERVHDLMKVLWRMRVIRYIPATCAPMILFNEERLPKSDIYIAPDTYTLRQRVMRERMESMLRYITNDTECRSVVLGRYFGDTETVACGVCDVCLRRKREAQAECGDDLGTRVLALLAVEPLTARELATRFECSIERLADTLEKLSSEEKISATLGGKLKINK